MRFSLRGKRAASLTVLVILLLLCCTATAWAQEEPRVTLYAAESTVHSGGSLTLGVTLSSPAEKELSIEVTDGGNPMTIAVPAGQTSAEQRVTVGSYETKHTETYALLDGAGYAPDEEAVKVKVLPSPNVSFGGSYAMVTAGKKLKVSIRCKNADELTQPLPVSLRLADGTVLVKWNFSDRQSWYSYEYKVPKDWQFPYSLRLFNEVTQEPCATQPVMVIDDARPGIRKVEAKGKIAISFDCGYNNVYTQYILDTLDEYDAKATFFVTGYFVEGFPDMLKEIRDRGHEIGNHTMTHPRLGRMEPDEIRAEIEGVNQGVYQQIGVRPKVMRPPFGSGGSTVAAVSRMCGCEMVYWTVDSCDWDPKCSAEKIISLATDGMGEGCIILFHNSAPKTEQTLRTILDDYKAKGLEIVPVSELLLDDVPNVIDADGLQQPDPNYAAFDPAQTLADLPLSVTVSGADGRMEELTVSPVFDGKVTYRARADVEKVAAKPSLMEAEISLQDGVTLPVRAGDTVGTATFSYKGEVWCTASLTAAVDCPSGGELSAVSGSDLSAHPAPSPVFLIVTLVVVTVALAVCTGIALTQNKKK